MTDCSIDFIYFDLGNVLVHFSHRRAADQIAALSGLTSDRVWEVLFTDGLQQRLEMGEIDDEAFCQAFNAVTGRNCDVDELARAGSDIFWLNPHMIPVLANLAAAGRPLGILSNTCAAHWRHVLGKFPVIAELSSTAVLSYEVGSMKPAASIYQKAIERAGCPAGRIFFIDDREENVAGASAAGLDAHLFESADQTAGLLRSRGVRFNY